VVAGIRQIVVARSDALGQAMLRPANDPVTTSVLPATGGGTIGIGHLDRRVDRRSSSIHVVYQVREPEMHT